MWNKIWKVACITGAILNVIWADCYRWGWFVEQDIPKATWAMVVAIGLWMVRDWNA